MDTSLNEKEQQEKNLDCHDGKTKNEVDYLLKIHKYPIVNVDVLNSFNDGIVRTKIKMKAKFERKVNTTPLIKTLIFRTTKQSKKGS